MPIGQFHAQMPHCTHRPGSATTTPWRRSLERSASTGSFGRVCIVLGAASRANGTSIYRITPGAPALCRAITHGLAHYRRLTSAPTTIVRPAKNAGTSRRSRYSPS